MTMPLPDTPPDRICIVMLTAVGDAVHVLPVVTALKRENPGARITWVLQPGPASLVRGHPDVAEIVVFERKRGLRGFLDVRKELRRRRFDITLAMQSYFKAGLITAFTRAPIKLGFDRERARDLTWVFTNAHLEPRGERHFQDQYLEFAEALGAEPEPLEWKLGPWEEERAWRDAFADRFDRPLATIVVATSKPEKDWPAERWAEVCDALWEDYGVQPVLAGGRSERELRAEAVIEERTRCTPVSTLGCPFRELVSVLDASALVLSPDTGPLHMSVAIGTPTISLLGYTNPKRVGPYRRFHDLMIDAYGDPEEDYPVSREYRPGRMERITVEDVLEKVALWEERYAGDG